MGRSRCGGAAEAQKCQHQVEGGWGSGVGGGVHGMRMAVGEVGIRGGGRAGGRVESRVSQSSRTRALSHSHMAPYAMKLTLP